MPESDDSKEFMVAQAGKRSLTSIVAVGLDGAIGVDNALPWRLKSDLKFFKETTRDNVVIMGRKTFESIGGCLPHRQNIVLSNRVSLFEAHAGCTHAHGIGETLFVREKLKATDAFVIGGAFTYQQFADYVDRYLVTIVKERFPAADAFFDQSIFGDESIWERRELDVKSSVDRGIDEFDFSVFELTHKNPEAVARRRAQMIEKFASQNHFLARKAEMKRLARREANAVC